MSSKNTVTISVALVTRNRADSLERTLLSLQEQAARPLEVVISDDSDPAQAVEVQRLAARYECRYISGPRKGLYANRNHVALACTGTHIRTMDDDHTFPPDHFQVCQAAVTTDPHAVWAIGEYYPDEEPGSRPVFVPGQLGPRGFGVKPSDPNDYWGLSDGASIFPKSLFDKGIRYADAFPFGASWMELGSRLHWLGYSLRWLEDTYVVHYLDPRARSFMSREIEVSSQVFAMLCHSFQYQPSPSNKLLSLMEMAKQCILHGPKAAPWLRAGIRAYRQQTKTNRDEYEAFKG